MWYGVKDGVIADQSLPEEVRTLVEAGVMLMEQPSMVVRNATTLVPWSWIRSDGLLQHLGSGIASFLVSHLEGWVVVVLSKRLSLGGTEFSLPALHPQVLSAFHADLKSRVWCTYRRDYSPFSECQGCSARGCEHVNTLILLVSCHDCAPLSSITFNIISVLHWELLNQLQFLFVECVWKAFGNCSVYII